MYNVQTISDFLMLIWRCLTVRNNLLQAGDWGTNIGVLRYLESLFQIRQQVPTPDGKGKQKMFRDQVVKENIEKPCAELKWLPPDGEDLNINVDGALIPASGKGAIGIIIRNCRGQHLLSAWKGPKHCRDAEEAEAWRASRVFAWP